MSRSITFFATKQDSLDLLLYLEKNSPLFYVRWGWYASRRDVPRYETAANIPDLGTAEFGRKGDNRYLVLPSKSTLTFQRNVNVYRGSEYSPVSRRYSPYIHFHSGGVYREECLIPGELYTNFDTREALAFFNRFRRAFRTRFTAVPDPWCGGRANLAIGPEALALFRAGMRFTSGYTMAPAYDYNDKLPSSLRLAGSDAAADRAAIRVCRVVSSGARPGS